MSIECHTPGSTDAETAAVDRAIDLRTPRLADAREIIRLVRESGALDVNSDYAYLLLCHHFNDTCLVAGVGDRLVGFTLGYRPPERPDTLFVWQIGVCGSARGRGLGLEMLGDLLLRHRANGVRYVEATVTPSNHASRALFESLARRSGVECRVSELFSSDMFAFGKTHEAEHLFRIGPLPASGQGSGPNE